MIPKPISERRRYLRIEESLPFEFNHQGFEVTTTTVNISSHGAMCRVDREIPMMTQLSIGLSLGGKKINAKGVVVRKEKDTHSSGYLLAVFFSDIKPADQKKLQDYIDSRVSA